MLIEEVEDKFWKRFNTLEKLEKHLLYCEGDDDDDILKREAFTTHKDNLSSAKPKEDPPQSTFPQNEESVQDNSPLPPAKPKEMKDPPEESHSLLPPTRECHFKIHLRQKGCWQ